MGIQQKPALRYLCAGLTEEYKTNLELRATVLALWGKLFT